MYAGWLQIKRLQAKSAEDRGLIKRLLDVGSVLACDIAWGLVVADSENRRDVAADVRQVGVAVGILASLHGAADVGSSIPDDLRKVTPVLPGVRRVTVHVDLGVVPHVGNDIGDLIDASGNVLAVLAVTNSPKVVLAAYSVEVWNLDVYVLVVGVDALVGNLLGPTGKLVVPLNTRSTVVGTVKVVVVESHRLEVSRGRLRHRVRGAGGVVAAGSRLGRGRCWSSRGSESLVARRSRGGRGGRSLG